MTVSYVSPSTFDTRGKLLGLSMILAMLSLLLPLYQAKYFGLVEETTFFDFTQERNAIALTYLALLIMIGFTFYRSRNVASIKKLSAIGLVAGITMVYYVVAGYIQGTKDLAVIEGTLSYSYGFLAFLASIVAFAISSFVKKSE